MGDKLVLRVIRSLEFLILTLVLYFFILLVVMPLFVSSHGVQNFFKKITAAPNEIEAYAFFDTPCPTGFIAATIPGGVGVFIRHNDTGDNNNTDTGLVSAGDHGHASAGSHSHPGPKKNVGDGNNETAAHTMANAGAHTHPNTGAHTHTYVPQYKNLKLCTFKVR